ncbi:MAG: 50S ribosomal protein L25/general stress protein Ctc [Colwellia sp.]|uniref:50S ribosomal protein L25/general stress protein Ctc n=1 Tax=Colwellia sp. TaxID=56799 RepID=UPI0025C55467|nr:50S ribosomal protein L25/general stress protein Ctc [Colwellia sp.]NQZ24963.1 50S ribosomal protein L25/general stress protein Ctc [Colwellia sp.]
MTDLLTLEAEVRTDLGKGASRRLRHADKVPAILYGENKESVSLTLAHKDVFRAQQEETFYTQVLTLNIAGEPVECLIKDMQRHPFKQLVMHLDFIRIDANHVVHAKTAIHFINEDEAAKSGANIAHHMNEIAITCLPKDLPEFITIDLAGLKLGQTLHLSDVTFPAGVTSDELAKGEEHDLAVVSSKAPKAAKVVDDEEAPAAEAPAAE